ncbi:hypothetical protein TNCV_2354221 [Trichonephila clavipes]|nr:hypothetical protein TNCV_2354221 [Trichonephila clavipes]
MHFMHQKGTISTILLEDLGKTKPLKTISVLKSIVTGDEFWCTQYDSEITPQSMEWKSQNSSQAKTSKKVSSKIKTNLITIFEIEMDAFWIPPEKLPSFWNINREYPVRREQMWKRNVLRKRISGYLCTPHCRFFRTNSLAEIVEVEIEVVSPSIVPSGSFTELKSHCHLYGAQGQRQAYLLPMPR